MRRSLWYVVNPKRKSGAAVARFRFEWFARLYCHFYPSLDYGRPGTF